MWRESGICSHASNELIKNQICMGGGIAWVGGGELPCRSNEWAGTGRKGDRHSKKLGGGGIAYQRCEYGTYSREGAHGRRNHLRHGRDVSAFVR
jgi:hypothetical protein